MSDLGSEVIKDLYRQLQIDDPWAVRGERNFTWWPGPAFRQTAYADVERPSMGDLITRISIVTPLMKDVPQDGSVQANVAEANQTAAMSAFVYDPGNRTVSSRSGVAMYEGNRPWLEPILWSAAALQIAMASDLEPEAFAQAIGGAADIDVHPDRGERRDRDEMLDVGGLYVAAGRRTRVGRAAFEAFAQMARESRLPRVTIDDRLATVRLSGPRGPVHWQLVSTQHPQLGWGLLTLLEVTGRLGDEIVSIANSLNLMEGTERLDGQFLGAWTVRDGRLFFTGFVPELIYAKDSGQSLAARMINLLLDAMGRTNWLGVALGRARIGPSH